MKLSEVPWKDIKMGQRVLAANGKLGRVDILKLNPGDRYNEEYVGITWDDGTTSYNWHDWMSEIAVVET